MGLRGLESWRLEKRLRMRETETQFERDWKRKKVAERTRERQRG